MRPKDRSTGASYYYLADLVLLADRVLLPRGYNNYELNWRQVRARILWL